MNRVFLLFRKDLLRRWRSPLGVLVMAAFPLVFSGMMALAFGGDDSGLPRARLLLENRDDGVASTLIKGFLTAEQVSEFLEVVEVGEEGRGLIEDGEASALLIIPEDTTTKLFTEEEVAFELIRNPAQGILPEVAEQITSVMTDVLSLAARLFHGQVANLGLVSFAELESFDDFDDAEFARLAVALRRLMSEAETFITEPPITFESTTLGEEEEDDEDVGQTIMIFLFILPGISVYSLFVIGDQMMRDILIESRTGMLRRQLCAPITGGQIIVSKVMLTAVVAGVVLLILAAIAGALAGVAVDLPAFAILSLALVLSVTGFAALIYGFAKTENQGSTASALVYLTMAFSGGSFVPLSSMPPVLRGIAPISPFYWGTSGFQSLLGEGGLADVLQNVAILGGLGLALLVAGSYLLQRKVLRGEAG